MSTRRMVAGIASVAVALAVLSTPLDAAHAAGGRPAFQVPFPCGERWQATTRAGHPAVDWNLAGSADAGRPVVAAAAGVAVTKYRYDWGYYTLIRHGGGWVTRYAHLQKAGRVEGAVAQGERIGYVGSTGRSTSAHLHWEQLVDGKRQSTLHADGARIRADGRTYTSRNCRQRGIHTGDVDGDGTDDTVARFVRSDGSSTVSVVRGAPSRALSAKVALQPRRWALPPSALLAVGDTDGNGRADLNAVYRRDGGVEVATFPGTASATFGRRRVRLSAPRWDFHRIAAVRAGDVDGDGVEDLTLRFLRRDGSSLFRLVRGDGAVSLRVRKARATSAAALPADARVWVGDTGGDGRADLNAARRFRGGTQIVTYRGRRDGTFGRRTSRLVASRWRLHAVRALRTADIDADGDEDVVLRILRGDGTSVLRTLRATSPTTLRRAGRKVIAPRELPPTAMLATGDTTGNGRADLNVAHRRSAGVQVSSYYGRTDTTLGIRRRRLYAGRWPFHRLC